MSAACGQPSPLPSLIHRYTPPMPDSEHKDQQDSAMNLINNSIIAGSNPPCVGDGGHLLASCRKVPSWRVLNLGGQSPLSFARELFQLPECKRFELNRIGHNRRPSQGLEGLNLLPGNRARILSALRAAAISISPQLFQVVQHLFDGTTAATAFLP